MADDLDTDKLRDEFAKLRESVGATVLINKDLVASDAGLIKITDQLTNAFASLLTSITGIQTNISGFASSVTNATNSISQSISNVQRDLTEATGTLSDNLQNISNIQQQATRDVVEELKDHTRQLEEIQEASRKKIESDRKEAESREKIRDTQDKLSESIGYATRAVKDFAAAIFDTTRGMEKYSSVIENLSMAIGALLLVIPGIGLAARAIGALGRAAQAVVTFVTKFPAIAAIFGTVAVGVAGTIIAFGKLTSEGLKLLSALRGVYEQLSEFAAVDSSGLTGVLTDLHKFGLTLNEADALIDVTQKFSDVFAAFASSAVEGRKIIADGFQTFGKQFENQARQLGLNTKTYMKEWVEAVSYGARTGKNVGRSFKDINQDAQEFIINLNSMSNYLGISKEALKQRRDDQNRELAVAARRLELQERADSGDTRAKAELDKFNAAMDIAGRLGGVQEKIMKETMIAGAAYTREATLFNAMVSQGKLERGTREYMGGRISEDQLLRQTQGQVRDTVKQFGSANVQILGEFFERMGLTGVELQRAILLATKQDGDFKRTRDGIISTSKSTDKLNELAIREAQMARDNAQVMENLLRSVADKVAPTLTSISESIDKIREKYLGEKPKNKATAEQFQQDTKKLIEKSQKELEEITGIKTDLAKREQDIQQKITDLKKQELEEQDEVKRANITKQIKEAEQQALNIAIDKNQLAERESKAKKEHAKAMDLMRTAEQELTRKTGDIAKESYNVAKNIKLRDEQAQDLGMRSGDTMANVMERFQQHRRMERSGNIRQSDRAQMNKMQKFLQDQGYQIRDIKQQTMTGQERVTGEQIIHSAVEQRMRGRADNWKDLIRIANGKEEHWNNLNENVKSRLLDMAKIYKEKTGQLLQLNSGARTREEQEALFKQYGDGGAAKPGTSKHESGAAVDIGGDQFLKLSEMGLLKSGINSRKSNGGAYHLEFFKDGGVANKPSVFGEAGPEAAVPLPDGRTIPVTISGEWTGMNTIADTFSKEISKMTSTLSSKLTDLERRMASSEGHLKKLSSYAG